MQPTVRKTLDMQIMNEMLISECFNFEFESLKRSKALQLYVTDYTYSSVTAWVHAKQAEDKVSRTKREPRVML